MDDIFRCFVICGNSNDAWSGCQPGDDTLTYTEEWARKQREKLNKKKTTFTVLVTGMGAYPKNPGHDEDGHYSEDDNTSHLVTTLLPSKLKPFSKYNPTALTIQILNPTSGLGCAVKSEYGYVRNFCKELWKNYGNEVDLILHLGMADGWEWYSVEKSGWKPGTVKRVDYGNGRISEPLKYYTLPDDINQTFEDIPGPCPWRKGVPSQLLAGPGFDIDHIAKHTEQVLNASRDNEEKKIEIRPHPDAGNYLCGFISYESFAQRYVNNYSAKALFCHIPGWRDEKKLAIGRDFVCSLIGQMTMQ